MVGRDFSKEIDRRVNDGFDPIPIKKNENITAPDQTENDMKLA